MPKALTNNPLVTVLGYLIIALTILSPQVMADSAFVAVAANFTKPMNELKKAFENTTGHNLKVSYGSTGKLYAQIRNGAPYQVFLSADNVRTQNIISDGLGVADSAFTYAIGRLVLWSKHPDKVDKDGKVLTTQFNKLALANPKTAPYGAAAVAVVRSLDLTQNLKSKFIQGENISQVFQFVSTGNADLGFIAFSQLKAIGSSNQSSISKGSYWLVPEKFHPAIKQEAVMLKKGLNQPAAQAFYHYLKSEEAREIIQSYGYNTSPPLNSPVSKKAHSNTAKLMPG